MKTKKKSHAWARLRKNLCGSSAIIIFISLLANYSTGGDAEGRQLDSGERKGVMQGHGSTGRIE